MKIISPYKLKRIIFMDGCKAKEALVARYMTIARRGFPSGTLAPLKRWIIVVAGELNMSPTELQEEVRVDALRRMKVANQDKA